MIEIDKIIVGPYVEGWVVKIPREGVHRHGNAKTHYRNSYFPRLDQCLEFIRDKLAGECTSVERLISLLEQCRDIDQQVLAQNGLTDSPKRIAA